MTISDQTHGQYGKDYQFAKFEFTWFSKAQGKHLYHNKLFSGFVVDFGMQLEILKTFKLSHNVLVLLSFFYSFYFLFFLWPKFGKETG